MNRIAFAATMPSANMMHVRIGFMHFFIRAGEEQL